MAKVISFKIQLEGSKDVLKEIDKIEKRLASSLKNASIKVDGKAFDAISQSTNELKSNVSKAGESISQMTKRITQLRQEGKENTDEYKSLVDQVSKLRAEQTKTNQQVKKGQSALEAQANLQKLINGEIKAGELSNNQFFAALNAGLDKADPKYDELVQDFVRLKAEQKSFNDDLRQQQRLLDQGSDVTGRYRKLNAELVSLRNAYKDLTDEEIRSGKISDELKQKYGVQSDSVKELEKRISELDKELKEADAKMGNYQRNVGNYASALQGVSGILSQVGIGIGVSELVGAIQAVSDLSDEYIRLEGIVSNLTNLQGADLENFTVRVNALAKVESFEVDDTEIVRAANTLAEQLTGGDYTQAIELIQTGLQGGLNISGDFLDRIVEYAPQFKEAGQSAEQLLETINIEVKTGVFSDKGVDSIKEATERIGRLESAALDGLDQLGISSAQIQQQLESGAITVDEVIRQASTAISGLPENSAVARQAIEKIFGTPGVDAGRKFIEQLKDVDGNIEEVADESNRLFQIQQKQIEAQEELSKATAELSDVAGGASTVFTTLGTNIQTFFIKALTALIKFVTALKEIPAFIKENRVEIAALGLALIAMNKALILSSLNTLRLAAAQKAQVIATKAVAIAQRIFNAVMTANPIGLVIAAVAGLIAVFTRLYKTSQTLRSGIAGTFSALKNTVKNIVGGLVKQLTGFGQLLKGVFTLDLEDIKAGAKKYAEGVGDVFLRAGQGAGDAFKKGFSEKTAKDLNKAIDKALEDGSDQLADSVNEQIVNALEKGQITNAQADEFQERLQRGLESSSIGDIDIDAKDAGINTGKQFGEGIAQGLSESDKDIVEARKKALENIRKLETGLISDEFDAEAVQATSAAESDISGLAGDPEQIRKQEALIKAQLGLSLSEIEKKRVASFSEVIERAKQAAANEIALLTGNPNEIAIQSEVIKQSLVVQIEGITTDRNEAIDNAIKQAEARRDAEIAALTGSPEEIEANAAVIRQTYTQAINGLTETRKNIIAQDEAEINNLRRQIVQQFGGEIAADLEGASLAELQIAKDALDQRLTVLDTELEALKQSLRTKAELKKAQLAIELQSGVSPERAQEIAKQLKAIDDKLKEDILKGERNTAKERLKAVKAIVPEALTEAERLAQAEIAIGKDKNEKLLADTRARVEAQKALEEEIKESLIDGAFEIAGAFANSIVEADKQQLDEQIRIQKERSDAQAESQKESTKAFYDTQIKEAEGNTERQEELRQELSDKLVAIDQAQRNRERQIELKNAREQKKIARKQALINAALAATKTLATLGLPAGIPALIALAAATTAQLIQIDSQKFEKGTALSNGVERYIADTYEAGEALSAPDINGSSAHIPNEGIIRGKLHKDGGVPATFNGTSIEVEKGEYKLRNGDETYIINRKSTKLFRNELDSLKGNTRRFDPAKREAASRINSFRGNGVKFASGGLLGVGAVKPLSAPVRLQNISGGVTREELSKAITGVYTGVSELAMQLDRKTDTIATEIQRETAAINSRIDRLTVYTDPVDIVNKGNERKQAQTAGEL